MTESFNLSEPFNTQEPPQYLAAHRPLQLLLHQKRHDMTTQKERTPRKVVLPRARANAWARARRAKELARRARARRVTQSSSRHARNELSETLKPGQASAGMKTQFGRKTQFGKDKDGATLATDGQTPRGQHGLQDALLNGDV